MDYNKKRNIRDTNIRRGDEFFTSRTKKYTFIGYSPDGLIVYINEISTYVSKNLLISVIIKT